MSERIITGEITGNTRALTGQLQGHGAIAGNVDGEKILEGSMAPVVNANGANGLSAYEIALKHGFEGSEEAWLASLKGPQGPQGPQGIQGVQGLPGTPVSHYWNGTTLIINSASGTSSADLKGGYYKPVVVSTGTNQLRIIWSAVGSGMPSVSDTTLTLPTGPQGNPGKDGKTPVKGTDYFTAADKAEMVNEVLAALPAYNGEVVTV